MLFAAHLLSRLSLTISDDDHAAPVVLQEFARLEATTTSQTRRPLAAMTSSLVSTLIPACCTTGLTTPVVVTVSGFARLLLVYCTVPRPYGEATAPAAPQCLSPARSCTKAGLDFADVTTSASGGCPSPLLSKGGCATARSRLRLTRAGNLCRAIYASRIPLNVLSTVAPQASAS